MVHIHKVFVEVAFLEPRFREVFVEESTVGVVIDLARTDPWNHTICPTFEVVVSVFLVMFAFHSACHGGNQRCCGCDLYWEVVSDDGCCTSESLLL